MGVRFGKLTWRLAVSLALVAGIIAVTASRTLSGTSDCGSYRADRVARIGSHKLDAQVVSTEAGMESGLGGRKCIASNQAMLFAFNASGVHAFWMKDMKFPIDIVWLDQDHSVVWLKRDVSPSTYPTSFFNEDGPAKYVLELKAGTAKNTGLKLGSSVSF